MHSSSLAASGANSGAAAVPVPTTEGAVRYGGWQPVVGADGSHDVPDTDQPTGRSNELIRVDPVYPNEHWTVGEASRSMSVLLLGVGPAPVTASGAGR